MKKIFFQILKVVLPVLLGLYLVVHIYKQLDDTQRIALFNAVKGANYFWVGLSFLMGLLSHYIRGYRWKFQLEAMGYYSPVSNNFMAVMIAYLVNMALPRVGEVSRAAALTKYGKVPFEKSFGSILSERAVDFVILLFIVFFTIIIQYTYLRSFADSLIQLVLAKSQSPILWISGILLLIFVIAGLLFLKKTRQNPFFARFWSLIFGLLEGLRSIVRMKKRGVYFLATAAIWTLYVGMFWICFFALAETAHLGANAVFASFVVGSFAIVLIPGGIGAFPVGIMQTLVMYGVAEETGFALGWIVWLSQTIMILIVGGSSMILMPIINRKKKIDESIATNIQ